MNQQKIQSLVDDLVRDSLDDIERDWAVSAPTSDNALREEQSAYLEVARIYHEALERHDYRKGKRTVDAILEEEGIEADKETYVLMCRSVLRGFVELHKIAGNRLYGTYTDRFAHSATD